MSVKALVNDLVKTISNLFNIEASLPAIKELSKFYNRGLEEMEVKFNMNFTVNKERLDSLQDYVIENIKDFNQDMKDRLRKTIMDGIMNNKPLNAIREEIETVFDIARNRAEMISRTETNRALNMGHKDAAKQSGLKLKKMVSVHMDDRTSPICKRMHNKYGKENQAIGMDEKFIDNETGKSFDITPFHVNCRSRILYVQED